MVGAFSLVALVLCGFMYDVIMKRELGSETLCSSISRPSYWYVCIQNVFQQFILAPLLHALSSSQFRVSVSIRVCCLECAVVMLIGGYS